MAMLDSNETQGALSLGALLAASKGDFSAAATDASSPEGEAAADDALHSPLEILQGLGLAGAQTQSPAAQPAQETSSSSSFNLAAALGYAPSEPVAAAPAVAVPAVKASTHEQLPKRSRFADIPAKQAEKEPFDTQKGAVAKPVPAVAK
ncbi:MAG: hypothetical protein RR866_05515, partial [Raoultibacter sp.]